ncbi:MAG TPA: hypothetical protein VIY49_22085 [Bryobacteraceae bacterium]
MDEIEAVLSRHLGRAPAPVELWSRVQAHNECVVRVKQQAHSECVVRVKQCAAANPARGGRRSGFIRAAWFAPAGGLAGFASAAAALLLAAFYFQPASLSSSNAVEIRNWVQVRAGIDLPLRADPPSAIRLTGARVSHRITEVTFEIGGRAGVLRVPAKATHQSYKLACATAEDERLACLLCHSGGDAF